MRGMMMVLVSPVEGREEEFEDWYEKVHIPDALEVDGFRSASRFEISDVALLPGVRFGEFRFVTLYELDYDDDPGFDRAAEALRQQFFGGIVVEHSKAGDHATKNRSSAMGAVKIAFLRFLGQYVASAQSHDRES